MTERKASEVLLELEQKINNQEQKLDLILGYLKTLDLNHKVIANRLQKSPVVTALDNAPPSPSPITSTPVKVATGLPRVELPPETSNKKTVIKPQPASTPVQPVTFFDAKDPVISVEPSKPAITEVGRKTPIHQQVLYPDGRPVILGNVEISNSQQEIVKKTKTNNIGKWSVILEPGQYSVHIFRSATQDKPAIDKTIEVKISGQEPMMELPILK